MKKNLFYLLLLTCSISLFTACSDDDDDVKLPIETDLAGTYKGDLSVVVDNAQMPSVPQRITISKSAKGNNQIALSIKDFSFATFNVGDIEVDPCQVKAISGGYSFEGKQTLVLAAPLGSCPVTITGTVKGNKVDIQIGVEVAGLNQTVKANFAGTKLAGNENAEAKILTFAFDSELVTQQPVIDDANGTISFKVNDAATDEQLKLTPVFTISEKATVTPATGVVQDFSNGKSVTYTVMAENGTMKKYVVSIAGRNQVTSYDFETWVAGVPDEPTISFHDPSGWSSSNKGSFMLKMMQLTDRDVVTQTSDAHGGKSVARIETLDSQGAEIFGIKVPKVTTGSLFLGSFEIDSNNTLNSTKFGINYTKKPISLKGFFKYTPGATYYASTVAAPNVATVDATKNDQFAIKVVLYTVKNVVTDPEDWSDYLTGVANDDATYPDNNIYTSSRVVAIGSLEGGAQSAWKEFDLKLEYKQAFDATKKYRMTIVCSSSKDGDKFSGAPGSVLTVDDFELIVE
ncbi:PCMD domain-containing protein [Bacteroides reticulotermitis]|uniref:PCMD domain-containing protein n=1 Tax=Bacteroides reticulotermitis TaxID=1133319 RepID=UPI003A8727F9